MYIGGGHFSIRGGALFYTGKVTREQFSVWKSDPWVTFQFHRVIFPYDTGTGVLNTLCHVDFLALGDKLVNVHVGLIVYRGKAIHENCQKVPS